MEQSRFFNANEVYGETFYQLPKVLFSNAKYRQLSDGAKIAYALLKDRFNYSIRNNWVDSDNNIFFIFTNDELMDLLCCGNKKVVRVKNELEETGLLFQKRMGVNKANRLYLLKPEVSATDVYQQANAESFGMTGNVKTTLPENVDNSGSVETTLPVVPTHLDSETLGKTGSVKTTHNLYKELLDTNIDTSIDTQTLDFSSARFSNDDLKQQSRDIVVNADESWAKHLGLEPQTLKLISLWANGSVSRLNQMVGLIFNAKRDAEQDITAGTGKPLAIVLECESELQSAITVTLRRVFNAVRQKQDNKQSVNPENYIYIALKNTIEEWYNATHMETVNQDTILQSLNQAVNVVAG